MKKFSIIWYALKFLLYIILSFIVSFGGLGLLAFLLKYNYGTSLTMSFLGMMIFGYGFLNFFFFLFTPPTSQSLKKSVLLLSIFMHPLFIAVSVFFLNISHENGLSNWLNSFKSMIPILFICLLVNTSIYFLAYSIKKAREQVHITKQMEKAESLDLSDHFED
ncbi:histidine kinase [Streptococcus sanguinis]|uniref:Histidine kinase n=1 Tax=Streptococcus sanguinis SK405 TaxID=888817 RepID=A0ABC9PH92_STRSA|nr:hypothetical protein [Streptococcus sanguinis]EGC25787.1 hypothetical protein HMPREF9390_0254 [Streptococcus sanguinis SK405]